MEETSDLTFHFRLLHPIFVARHYYYTLFNKENEDDGGRRSNSFYFAEQASSDGKGNSIFVRLEVSEWDLTMIQVIRMIRRYYSTLPVIRTCTEIFTYSNSDDVFPLGFAYSTQAKTLSVFLKFSYSNFQLFPSVFQ